MSEWLFKNDDYNPEEDKDKFIDKSIFSVLKVLSRIKREGTSCDKRVLYTLNPTLKLLFTFVIIVFSALTRNAVYLGIVTAAALFNLMLLSREDRKRVFYSAVVFTGFAAITLVPSMVMGNLNNSLFILIKVLASIIQANVLSHSTRWSDLSKALKLFFVPDIFILVFELTLRYIYVLGESASEMLYALKLRSVGRNSTKYNSLSGILGNLFLKSKDMGEEMYAAMECRGFTGDYTSEFKFAVTPGDIAFILYNILITAAYFVFK